jgi:hypothetical protein
MHRGDFDYAEAVARPHRHFVTKQEIRDMRLNTTTAIAALTLASMTVLAASPADARWRHRHGGWGWGGAAAGLAAGAIIGSALAPRPYYGPDYVVEPYAAVDDDAVSYCMQRFKSYDPSSGTYLGYDGYRHPCP